MIMMSKDIVGISGKEFFDNEFSVVFGRDDKKMDRDYFVKHYKKIILRYISNGKPSDDTKNSYYSAIDQFIFWCSRVKVHPLDITEQQMMYYRAILIEHNLKSSSVAFKLTALRRFFFVAEKYKLIDENPVKDVHAQRDPDNYMPVVKYLTANQLSKMISVLSDKDEKQLRTKTMIYLMAVEGLRTVEVHRMNVEDIDFGRSVIYIRGKGHNDMIYPSRETMKYLALYISKRYAEKIAYTPVFTSTSNRSKGKRMSRNKIRDNIDRCLESLNLKSPGKSCHMLRHTCGTLLYGETKDLQIVKTVLRHRNIEMTSRYSHVQDAMLKRYTSAIPVIPDFKDEE